MAISLIRPPELDNPELKQFKDVALEDVWLVIHAVLDDDAGTFRALLEMYPGVATTPYFFTHPLHFAVREGRLDMVRLLLDKGAPPDYRHCDDLATTARDRGHDRVAALIEERQQAINISTGTPTALHAAAAAGDPDELAACLKEAAGQINIGNADGLTPLHLAVRGGHRDAIALLIDAGAATTMEGRRIYEGFQPIDMALWENCYWSRRPDGAALADYLIGCGVPYDLSISAALGDQVQVERLLAEAPAAVNKARPNGRRAVSAAAQAGHETIVKLLLDAGADPTLSEGAACPQGHGLWAAAYGGHYTIAEMLLRHNADPNAGVESCGPPVAVDDRAMRYLMYRYGGRMSPMAIAYRGDLDSLNAYSREALEAENAGQEGGLYKVALRSGDWDLLHLLQARGLPFPRTMNYDLLPGRPDMARYLLERGMNPDISNWQRCTALHAIGAKAGQEKPLEAWLEALDLFLTFGADLNAVDEEYRSTPLGWAARCGHEDLIEPLIQRGADLHLADAPWATPAAWADKRGRQDIADLLRRHDADA